MINDIFDKEWIRAELRARRRRKSKEMFFRVMIAIGIMLLVLIWCVILFGAYGCSSARVQSLGNGILVQLTYELKGGPPDLPVIEYRLPEEYEVRALMRHGLQFNEGIWGRNEQNRD